MGGLLNIIKGGSHDAAHGICRDLSYELNAAVFINLERIPYEIVAADVGKTLWIGHSDPGKIIRGDIAENAFV